MKTISLFFLVFFVSCSSVSEKVIQRMDDINERPSWASISKTMFLKDGRVYSVGLSESEASARISAASRIADNNARFEISRMITNESSFIFQNAEEGLDDGGQLSRFYGNELSKHVSHGVRQENRYWEKVRSFNQDGDEIYKLRLYSMVSIKESDLKKAITEALNKEKGLTPQMQKAIDNHITRQIEGLETK